MSAELPAISIVVIGHNEGERLIRCLESIRAADYPQDKIELIYVDSDSTDGSCEAADRLGAGVVPLVSGRPTAAAARNAGFHVAQRDLIQFLDGDTVLQESWLRRAVREIAEPKIACVFGKVEEQTPQATIYHFWAHHDWFVPPGPAESCGGIAMFRRGVLHDLGGYDESLIAGEEPDLCYRLRHQLGLTVLCIDEPMTLHDIGITRFSQYWRRCVRTGHAYAEVGGRHRGMRSWRAARWRNLGHAAAPLLAVTFSVILWSFWPVAVWMGLLGTAVLRNALRVRRRVGSTGGALLYSLHHYLSKIPMTLGQCSYWLRSVSPGASHPLVECPDVGTRR